MEQPLTPEEKNQIKTILQAPQWQTIERAVELICQRVNEQSPLRDSEWETLKATLEKEFRVKALREFVNELYNNAE